MATTAMPPQNKKAKGKVPKTKTKAKGQSMQPLAAATQPVRQLLSLPQLSQYFNALVQLVPPRFYFDNTSEQLDLKHMKKRERELAKASIKNKGKANKRAKLNPEAAQTTLDVQQQQAAARAQQRTAWLTNAAQADAAAPAPTTNAAPPTTQPTALTLNLDSVDASKEELRERLRRRIEACRAQRHAEERTKSADEAKAWRQKKLAGGDGGGGGKKGGGAQQQHKNGHDGNGKKRTASAALGSTPEAATTKHARTIKNTSKNTAKPNTSMETTIQDLAFGNIKVQSKKQVVLQEGKRKHKSKAALLAAAHAAAQTTSNPHTTSLHTTSPHTTSPHPPPAPADATEAREEAWRAALMRARGEKVLDDPRLLRKSLKREAKAKQKSKQAWQQRKQKQSDEQAARQQRRNENINKRVQAKSDKKKARREKKLMRAGFEGRKAGFINGGK